MGRERGRGKSEGQEWGQEWEGVRVGREEWEQDGTRSRREWKGVGGSWRE